MSVRESERRCVRSVCVSLTRRTEGVGRARVQQRIKETVKRFLVRWFYIHPASHHPIILQVMVPTTRPSAQRKSGEFRGEEVLEMGDKEKASDSRK